MELHPAESKPDIVQRNEVELHPAESKPDIVQRNEVELHPAESKPDIVLPVAFHPHTIPLHYSATGNIFRPTLLLLIHPPSIPPRNSSPKQVFPCIVHHMVMLGLVWC